MCPLRASWYGVPWVLCSPGLSSLLSLHTTSRPEHWFTDACTGVRQASVLQPVALSARAGDGGLPMSEPLWDPLWLELSQEPRRLSRWTDGRLTSHPSCSRDTPRAFLGSPQQHLDSCCMSLAQKVKQVRSPPACRLTPTDPGGWGPCEIGLGRGSYSQNQSLEPTALKSPEPPSYPMET